MISTEDSDLFVATCDDCNTTKTYFTSQGVAFFKLSHEGHKLRVKEPWLFSSPADKRDTASGQVGEDAPAVTAELTEPVAGEEGEPRDYLARVSLGNLVVDVVDDVKGRCVKLYGISGGLERFTKEFAMDKLHELNELLESGEYRDASSGSLYTWTPDKIDISDDVAGMLNEPPAQESPARGGATPQGAAPAKRAEVPAPPKPQARQQTAVKPLSAPEPPGEVLLGKLSYIQPGEGYLAEGIRVSKVLRKFRWNTEPPYVIGALFDDLVSVQSQTGRMEAGVVAAVSGLGYTFVGFEAPSGVVTAWFRRNDPQDSPAAADAAPGPQA